MSSHTFSHPYGPHVPEDREIDWDRLLDLRDAFLAGEAGKADYWEDDALLADYDDTFGRRIAWKWAWVLEELKKLKWSPPAGLVHDWACGPGVGLRTYAGAFSVKKALFSDRSSRATRYASTNLTKEVPGVEILRHQDADQAPAVLLASHVLSELDDAGLAILVEKMQSAESIIWVEPGTSDLAKRMIPVRQLLMGKGFHVVAPCTHQGQCPMAEEQHERHWCHHFATPPHEIFMDAFWAYFGKHMGVDLRSLPLSFLVLDKRPPAALPANAMRIIGRSRVLKPYAQMLGCDAAGLHDTQVAKRHHAALYRQLRHHEAFSLAKWELAGQQVTKFQPWD